MLGIINLKYIVYKKIFRIIRRSDDQKYCFKNVENQILVKEQGQICGQQFIIENCSVSLNDIL